MAKVRELSEYEKEQRKNNYHYLKNGKPKVGSIISGRVHPRPTGYGRGCGMPLVLFGYSTNFLAQKTKKLLYLI